MVYVSPAVTWPPASQASPSEADALLRDPGNVLRVETDGELVLRFSRLFGPMAIADANDVQLVKARGTHRRQAMANADADDAATFLDSGSKAWTPESGAGPGDDDDVEDDPRYAVGRALYEGDDAPELAARLDPSSFSLIEQLQWEDDVRMETPPATPPGGDAVPDARPAATASDASRAAMSFIDSAPPEPYSASALPEAHRPLMLHLGRRRRPSRDVRHGQSLPQWNLPTVHCWDQHWDTPCVPQRATSMPETPAALVGRNDDFESMSWLEDVAWDRKPKAGRVPLLLNANDRNMIFVEEGDETEVPTESQPPPQQAPASRFNVSHDDSGKYASYRDDMGAVVGKTGLQHALFAKNLIEDLFPTDRKPQEWAEWHRPQLRLARGSPMALKVSSGQTRPSPQASSSTKKFVPRRVREVSGKDGDLVLMEYVEQHPLLIQTTGMASELVTFYRQRNDKDGFQPQPEHGTIRVVSSEMDDETPFLGKIRPGVCIQALNNNMFAVPVVRQHLSTSTTDFLLCVSSRGTSFSLRPLPALFLAGQIQPKMEVPAPNSRAASAFMKRRLTVYMHRKLQERGAIQISEVFTAFPDQSETAIRAKLKEVAAFQRRGDLSGYWTPRPDRPPVRDTVLWDLVTPEALCVYERLESGRQALRDQFGIALLATLTQSERIFIAKMAADHPLKRVALFIEQQTRLTPWNLSSNFCTAMNGLCVLRLNGPGNPIGRGGGLSYLRAPTRAEPDPIEEKLGPATGLTGTNKDLRKLDMNGLRDVLLSFGVPKARIDKLLRWERVDLVRLKATEAARDGHDNEWSRFARSQRNTYRALRAQFLKDAQRLLERQCELLAGQEGALVGTTDQDDATVDEMEEWAKDLESMMESEDLGRKKKNGKAGAADEDEAAEYNNWVESKQTAKLPKETPSQQSSTRDEALPATMTTTTTTVKKRKTVKRKRLKKVVTTMNASDGTTTTMVTMIDDPDLVEAYAADLVDNGTRFYELMSSSATAEHEIVDPSASGNAGAMTSAVDAGLERARQRLDTKKRRRGRLPGSNARKKSTLLLAIKQGRQKGVAGRKRGRPKVLAPSSSDRPSMLVVGGAAAGSPAPLRATGDTDTIVSAAPAKKVVTVRCSRCKMVGHTKSNSKCPALVAGAAPVVIERNGSLVVTLKPASASAS
ncbi:hypothetical protein PBRA_005250 [Plasmodiophora brassicae]|nr:hypothetical protein PBRA_005250 [Plasmodiophora brassicae]